MDRLEQDGEDGSDHARLAEVARRQRLATSDLEVVAAIRRERVGVPAPSQPINLRDRWVYEQIWRHVYDEGGYFCAGLYEVEDAVRDLWVPAQRSRRTVKRSLRDLVEAGALIHDPRPERADRYYIADWHLQLCQLYYQELAIRPP